MGQHATFSGSLWLLIINHGAVSRWMRMVPGPLRRRGDWPPAVWIWSRTWVKSAASSSERGSDPFTAGMCSSFDRGCLLKKSTGWWLVWPSKKKYVKSTNHPRYYRENKVVSTKKSMSSWCWRTPCDTNAMLQAATGQISQFRKSKSIKKWHLSRLPWYIDHICVHFVVVSSQKVWCICCD